MPTTLDSATAYFRRLVDAMVFPNIDECWESFADYLAHRSQSLPAAMVGFFHGKIFGELMESINLWMEKRPSRLLDPKSDDKDAEPFRDFDKNERVLSEVKGFIQWKGHSHLFE